MYSYIIYTELARSGGILSDILNKMLVKHVPPNCFNPPFLRLLKHSWFIIVDGQTFLSVPLCPYL